MSDVSLHVSYVGGYDPDKNKAIQDVAGYPIASDYENDTTSLEFNVCELDIPYIREKFDGCEFDFYFEEPSDF